MKDERLMARLSNRNLIEIYDPSNFGEAKYKIQTTADQLGLKPKNGEEIKELNKS